MKKFLLVLVGISFLSTAGIFAKEPKCVSEAKAARKSAMDACKDKKGKEKQVCQKDIQPKFKAATGECNKTQKSCMGTAKKALDDGKKACADKKGKEKQECMATNGKTYNAESAKCKE